MEAAVSEKSARTRVPAVMQAAVYTGNRTVSLQAVETPAAGPGELLVRVESCGICHTDLKKIEYNLLPAPRIFGHETAGVVVEAGEGAKYEPGDRVVAFHHVPCQSCFYCERKLYAQCAVYKKVGITAGYQPAGGGFAQYVRVMDWIARAGVERIPAGVPFDRACLVEPVNTCLKGVELLGVRADDTVLVMGQGPIGLIFTMLVRRLGARVLATDGFPSRRELAIELGAAAAFAPGGSELRTKSLTEGRGADVVIVAASAAGIVEEAIRCSRPGAKILLFAQTSEKERIDLPGAGICVEERTLLGSYSASIDLQKESARLVFSGEIPVERLISHRVALNEIAAGIDLALHPDEGSLKIIVQPQRWS